MNIRLQEMAYNCHKNQELVRKGSWTLVYHGSKINSGVSELERCSGLQLQQWYIHHAVACHLYINTSQDILCYLFPIYI